MLLAYIDEIGQLGAFVSRDHERHNTSPAFGYAGFVIPEENARKIGGFFQKEKSILFSKEFEDGENRAQKEFKGSDVFRWNTDSKNPGALRVFKGLVKQIADLNGRIFYYVDEKPIGTPDETTKDYVGRERAAMRETLNRLARYAHQKKSRIMVMIDAIDEHDRVKRVADMYQHIFGRSEHQDEMRSLIEPPMHIDSRLSSNIQLADWIAGYLSRCVERHLLDSYRCEWLDNDPCDLKGKFTSESKIHLQDKSIGDIHHEKIVLRERPKFDVNDISVLRSTSKENQKKIQDLYNKSNR